ncbi:MAG TPA: hypothetical protein V6C95_12130 [Coleofasciculaceae cyanobacterium]
MNTIQHIVQEALTTGCLTIIAENQLRQLLSTKYGTEDFRAFMRLQYAAMDGLIQQESRQFKQSSRR